jgi:PAS domain S-box-containing protein
MMTKDVTAEDEARRIQALRELKIDIVPEEDFDNIVALACLISEAPFGVVWLLDQSRIWYNTTLDFAIDENKVNDFFKSLHLNAQESVIIDDCRLDTRMKDYHFPAGTSSLDSIALFPLTAANGLLMGYLTVADVKPKVLTNQQITGLKTLAKQTVSLFNLRQELQKSRCVENAFRMDLIDQRQDAIELDKQKSFYETILNNIPTDIAVFDSNHRYLFVNPFAIGNEELRKYIIGKDDFEYARYRNRDEFIPRKRREQFLQAKASGKEIRWEDTIVNPSGRPITHLRRLFPVYDQNGGLVLFIGFGVDITERKLLEEKQAVLVKQLSAQNTQLLDFCNIVSHNLRGPLINMSMLVTFVEESSEPEEIKVLVSKLSPVIESLNTTFNELVESIQVRQNLEIESEILVLKECLQRAIDGLEMEVEQSNAEIVIDLDNAPTVNFPPKYMNSIFHNLISNALKYRSPERPLKIEISTRKNPESVLLMIKDNGLGLDLEKHKDSIFKIGKVFHKHPNAKGLGLYMTRAQVEAMGGKIWVESAPNEGATFYIVFTNQIHK